MATLAIDNARWFGRLRSLGAEPLSQLQEEGVIRVLTSVRYEVPEGTDLRALTESLAPAPAQGALPEAHGERDGSEDGKEADQLATGQLRDREDAVAPALETAARYWNGDAVGKRRDTPLVRGGLVCERLCLLWNDLRRNPPCGEHDDCA